MGRSTYALRSRSFIKHSKSIIRHSTSNDWTKLSISIDLMRICSDKHRMNRRHLPFQYTDSEHTNPVLASVTPPYRPRLFVTARGGPDKKGVKTGRNMCAVCLILPNWQDYADNWLASQPLSRVRQSEVPNMIEYLPSLPSN